jgi:hypothetical protein
VVFTPSARVSFNATVDLDNVVFHPWDGGGVRAIFLF